MQTETRTEATETPEVKPMRAEPPPVEELEGHDAQEPRAPDAAPADAGAAERETEHAWARAPAPLEIDLDIEPRQGQFINGSRRADGRGAEAVPIVDPSTGEPVSQAVEAREADLNSAMRSAEKAQAKWAGLAPLERARILYSCAEVVRAGADELAALESTGTGIPIARSLGEDVALIERSLISCAGWCDKLAYAAPGARPPAPAGVVAHLIGDRSPLAQAGTEIAQALCTGCASVVRIRPQRVIGVLRLAEILSGAGLPGGLVGVLVGEEPFDTLIVQSQATAVVDFCGSRDAASIIARIGADRGTPVFARLEEATPVLVGAGASLSQAVEGVAQALVRGHQPRVIVEERFEDRFVGLLKGRLASLRIGPALDRNTELGPLASFETVFAFERAVAIARERGAAVWTPDGCSLPEQGHFALPTLLRGARADVLPLDAPGPVVTVTSVPDPERGLALIERAFAGRGAVVWADKGQEMFELVRRMNSGTVWCNTFPRRDASSPLGARGRAGVGRTGGAPGLRRFLRT